MIAAIRCAPQMHECDLSSVASRQMPRAQTATVAPMLVTGGSLHPRTIMKNAADNLLTGKHVLLVEDQTLIALDTEALLRELGAQTVETFTQVEDALAWLASATPDVAVLDINLGSDSSFSIAEEIQRRGKPLIFTTGYSEGFDVPDVCRDVPIVRKPYTRDAIAGALIACLGGVGAS